VRRWLEVASACECSTLDVCALFDDRALGVRELSPERDPRDLVAVLVSPGGDRCPAATPTT